MTRTGVMTPIELLLSETDWSRIAIGPPQQWPQSLQVAFNICRTSRFPIILFWGREHVQLYNDAYIPILGARRPAAFGQRARDCWPEIWDAIGPMLGGVMDSGNATWSENLLLPLERYGAPEECYFTFSYSPIDDGERVGGVFCAVVETTATVLGERHARERAEALAELDRAKSEFFNNVSHEFRTPLTLMLGPLETVAQTINAEDRPLIEIAQRNTLRLLKLVNTLLQFSRLESERRDASFVESDLARMTTDLAAGFRSAIEHAGLELIVTTELDRPVFVDPAMWETIVSNLLSNALKFTLQGTIRVELTATEGAAHLAVVDSGAGIPPGELPHVFERFHRVRSAPSRSHEGSGIGLALTRELVRLHGGSIAVRSEPGNGTAFEVSIPFGSAHLDPAQIVLEGETGHASSLDQYLADVEVALENTGSTLSSPRPPGLPAKRARILYADDNRDLREYVTYVLTPFHDVVAAKNGREALEAARSASFDLIVSDVMMPDMDGLALLEAVRGDEALAALPFIFLSARAGEEPTLDGLRRGADAYIAKPFTAQELVARVNAALGTSARQEAFFEERTLRRWFEQQGDSATNDVAFRTFANQLPIPIWQQDIFGSVSFTNNAWHETLRLPRVPSSHTGDAWKKIIHPDDFAPMIDVTTAAIESRESFEINYRLKPSDGGDATYRWYSARAVAQFDVNGAFKGWIGSIIDIHESRLREDAERRLRLEASKALADFQALADSVSIIVYTRRPDGSFEWANRRFYEMTQLPREGPLAAEDWRPVMPPEEFASFAALRERAVALGEPYEAEVRFKSIGRPDSAYRWHLVRVVPMRDGNGAIVRWAGTATDIHDRRVAAAERERDLRTLSEALPTIVWTATPEGAGEYFNRRLTEYSGLSPAEAAGDGWLSILHPEDIERTAEVWGACVADGSMYDVDYRIRRSDGEYRWFHVLGLPLYDSGGAIVRWIGTCTDIDDAKRSYDRERRASEAFQEAALPKSLPAIPGLTFSAIYRAGSAEAFVGGDWYDAFNLFEGRVVLSVGDVMGSGLNAAVVMSAVRHSIRGAAQIESDPCAIIAAADRALQSEHPEAIVTAFVGIFDPVLGTITYASAGHPPPFLREAEGAIVALNGSGPPLGFRPARKGQLPQTLHVPARSWMLVLYTDGFTEAMRDIDEGEARLHRAMSSEAVIASPDPAREILATSLARIRDDVAILVVRLEETVLGPGRGVSESSGTPHAPCDAAAPAARPDRLRIPS
jgi:PAS domain S-box-containing protein